MMNEKMLVNCTLSFVIPCFNEESTIIAFYNEALEVISALSKSMKDFSVELIFVDDGSKDKTLNILKNLSKKDNNVHYIAFSRNFGKEAAMLAGLQKANGQYIVTLDSDLQDPPSLIIKMFEAVVSGDYDCARSRRVTRKGEPLIKSFFAKMFYKVMALITDITIVDGARDFCLMNRKYVDAILSLHERNRFSKGIFPWIGFKVKWFEYDNIERIAGVTKWSFWKLFLYSLDGIIAFSLKPLIISSFFSILLFFITFCIMLMIIVRKLIWDDPVSGWASTVCIILFCSSIQLFSVSVLGQYIAKIYTEAKQRPPYIISEEK
jgi:glycosyltransferase involved in cell wall biosynthesis